MAAAAAPAAEEAAPPKNGKKKKLIIIIVAVVVLLGAGGGGAAFWLAKKRAAEAAAAAEEAEADDAGEHGAGKKKKKTAKHDTPTGPPTFLPLEPFVVNLADRESDRFAQVGITLEVSDGKAADLLKQYMPAIRDGVLMTLAHKSSAELLERAGKEKFAAEVAQAALAPLPPPEHGGEPPVRKVHFSSFIIQ